MTATLFYRIAAGLFVIFAAGHTVGFLRFRPPTPEGQALFASMDSVTFLVGRGTYSYGRFYRGFGLYVTLYLLFSAFLAWHLGDLAATDPLAIGALGWIFCAVQLVSLVISWIHFSPPPVVLSAGIAFCLGYAVHLTSLHLVR
jgi:hypothetical protein